METIQIVATIRPANTNELFSRDPDKPFHNVTYFVKESPEKPYIGPFVVTEETDEDELFYWHAFRMLNVIVTDGQGFSFVMNLRPATIHDLVVDGQLLINRIFYIMNEDNTVDGPYFIGQKTDRKALAKLFVAKRVYTVSENQHFTPYQQSA